MNSDKKKESIKELEMAKKRDHKIMITDEAIKKGEEITQKLVEKYTPIILSRNAKSMTGNDK